jgi:S-adenosyl-L-methionine hydrolase (adenosine-forming)
MRPLITLTTDFGLSDPYVGIMKGVILGIAPHATIVDVTHGVPPQDVMAGALALEAAFSYFAKGTVHVVVVDPGVGSDRAAVAVETEAYFFVGPDNGIIPTAIAGRQTIRKSVHLTNENYHIQPVSKTFHGRDMFAPAAAYLASSVPIHELGESLPSLAQILLPEPSQHGDRLEVHVVHVDHFGNLITDVREEYLVAFAAGRAVIVEVGEQRIDGLRETFADVGEGDFLAYVGSGGRLEIGMRNGNAAEALEVGRGAVLSVTRL